MAILDYTATKHEDGGVRITLDDPRFEWKEARFPHTTVSQMAEGHAAYCAGKLIQQAYPFLTPSEREFLMTGMDDAEWAEMEAEAEKGADMSLEESLQVLRSIGLKVYNLETQEDFDEFCKALSAEIEGQDAEEDEEPDANACAGCGDEDCVLNDDGLCPTCVEEQDGCPICGRNACLGYCETGYGVH